MDIEITQKDDGKQGRFVLFENDVLAGEMTYTWEEKDKMVIRHTEVGDEFQGKGYGKKLVMKAVEAARSRHFKIKPYCIYAKAVFDRDAQLADVKY